MARLRKKAMVARMKFSKSPKRVKVSSNIVLQNDGFIDVEDGSSLMTKTNDIPIIPSSPPLSKHLQSGEVIAKEINIHQQEVTTNTTAENNVLDTAAASQSTT